MATVNVEDLWKKLKKLPADKRTLGPDRTITAVTRRMYLLRMGTAKNRPRKQWTAADDKVVLSTARKTKRGKMQAITDLATRLHASEYFVKLRWNALCGNAGVAEPEMSENDDEPRQDEESSVRREPPISWIDVEEAEGLAPTNTITSASIEEENDEKDDVPAPQPISPGPQEWGMSAVHSSTSAYQSEVISVAQGGREDVGPDTSVEPMDLEVAITEMEVSDSGVVEPSVDSQGADAENQDTAVSDVRLEEEVPIGEPTHALAGEEMPTEATSEVTVGEDVEMSMPSEEAPVEDSSHMPIGDEAATQVTIDASVRTATGDSSTVPPPDEAGDTAVELQDNLVASQSPARNAPVREMVDVPIKDVPAVEETGSQGEEAEPVANTVEVTSASELGTVASRGELRDAELEEGECKEPESAVLGEQPSSDTTTALAGQVGGDPSEVTVLVDQQSAASLPSTSQAEIHVDVASADEAKDDEDSDGIPVGSTTPLPDWTDADEKRHHLQYNEFKSKWLRYDYVDPQNGRTVKGIASPQTYHLVGTKYLDRESTLYKFWFAYYERTLRLPAADAQDSRSFGWKAPKFTREMYRELMVAATLLLRNDASRTMFLREMWVCEYGDCRDNICCLKYDINAPGFTYFGTCRHWEYYSKKHVYLDRFASDGNYRLALALASHMEMMAATDSDKMGKPESSKDRVKLEVAACMMAHQVITKLPRNKAAQTVEHLEPLLGSLTAILFSDAMNADARCRRVPLFAWDFGDLVVEEDDGDRVLGRAILCRVDTNLLLTKADVDVVNRNMRRLVWVPCTNVMNYARRLFAAEGATTDAKPLITKLLLRDPTTTPRSQSEVSRALSTPQWHDARRLDQDQRDVVRRIVTEKGITLVRGPYGCGKTTTLTSTVATYHAAYPDERIAIVSETNAAINEDLRHLVEGNMVNKRLVLRLGECEPTMKGFRDVYLSELCAEERARLRHLELSEDVVRREVNKFEQKKLEQARIIVATLSITGRTDYQVRTLQFDLVINDEGAQTTETAVIQALRTRTHSLASFGDHNQLLGFSPLPEHQLDQFSEGTVDTRSRGRSIIRSRIIEYNIKARWGFQG